MIGLAGIAGRTSAAPEGLEPNSYEDITSYNNYYEFGTGKDDPARYADRLTIEPWTVQIDGLVDKPGAYGFDDIMQQMTIDRRAYLSFSLCRGVVNGGPVERVRAGGPAEYGRCAVRRKIRLLRDCAAS